MTGSGKRAVCPHCERPVRTCLCRWVCPTANQAEVLILQHPLEVRQAKGSARLLQLSLARCSTRVGEVFDPAELQAWLAQGRADGVQPVLLYPPAPGTAHEAGAFDVETQGQAPARIRLVVLDGTWRKSLKMLHLNPVLQRLPRLALHPDAPSRYLIRKAPRSDQLSTLEACCLALAHIEHDAGRYQPLRQAFDQFVGSLAQGAETLPPA